MRVLLNVLMGVGVEVEVSREMVAEGTGFVTVGVFEGEGACTSGVKGMVVIVGMIAVMVNSAMAVEVASPLRKILSTESVGVGTKLLKNAFPIGVPANK